MKFKLYINEGRSQEISFDQFLSFAPKCSDAIKSYRYSGGSKGALYRGISNRGSNRSAGVDMTTGDYLSVDPSKFNRKPNYAAEGGFYFSMIDGLPSWKDYPSRSKSVIGATEGGKYDSYGQSYSVYPANGSRIALASGVDLWSSFGGVFGTSSYDEILGSFTEGMVYMMRELTDEDHRKFVKVNNVADLKKFCSVFDEYYDTNFEKDKNELMSWVHDWVEEETVLDFINYFYKGNLWNDLNTAFAPGRNGFKLVKSGDNIRNDVEWWSDGFCLMVSFDAEIDDDRLRKEVGAK